MSYVRPIGTTERGARLTARQVLGLLELQKHACPLCGEPMLPDESYRDEHLRALGLGGSNAFKNRGLVHVECAEAKDLDDMRRINKAKNQKIRHYGIKPAGAFQLRSAGFRKFAKPPRVGAERIDKSALPALPRRNPVTGRSM